MTKKEKIRFAAAIAFSLICAVGTFFIAEAAICEFMMMPSKMTNAFYGFLLLWVMMMEIAMLIFGIGTICAGVLGAFFAFSFWKHPKKSTQHSMRSIFISDLCFIALDTFALAVLLF